MKRIAIAFLALFVVVLAIHLGLRSRSTPLKATGGTGTGMAQDATGQAILGKLGLTTPQGGTGTGALQDSTMQVLLNNISPVQTPGVPDAGTTDASTVVLTANPVDGGTQWVPSSSISPGWQTALDLDFTAQASQTFATDGTYTIAGLTWTKYNSANEVTHAAITNGTGLVFQPASSTTYMASGVATLPALRVPITSIVPAADYGTEVRVWMYESADNSAANYDGADLAIDDNLTVGGRNGALLFRGFDTGGSTQGQFASFELNGTNATVYGVTETATHRVLVLETSLRDLHFATAMAGAWSSGWPASSSLVSISTPVSNQGIPYNDQAPASSIGITLGAQRSGSLTALSITIARLRVDYRLNP